MVCRWFFFWGVGCVDRISVSGGFQVDVQFYEFTHTFFVVFSGLFHPSYRLFNLCYAMTLLLVLCISISNFSHLYLSILSNLDDERNKLLISAISLFKVYIPLTSYFVSFIISFQFCCLHLHRHPYIVFTFLKTHFIKFAFISSRPTYLRKT